MLQICFYFFLFYSCILSLIFEFQNSSMKMAKSKLSKIDKKRKKTDTSKSSTKHKCKDAPALVTPATAATIVAQRSDENHFLFVFLLFLKFCCSPIRLFLSTDVLT